MTEGTSTTSPGLFSALRHSPVSERLRQEVKDLAKAQATNLAGDIGKRVSAGTDKLGGQDGEGGGGSALLGGVKRIAEGQSPLRAATGTAFDSAKNKIKGLFKRGKGKRQTGPQKVTNIHEALDVGVPVSVAYDQWTQFEQFPQFMKGVEGVDAKSETEQNWRIKVFKSRRSWKGTTTEQVPDRRIVWTSEGAKGSTKGVVTFHPLADDLTRVLLSMEYYPSGFFEKTGNIWRAGGRRARLDLKHFRRFVTMRGEATGSWRGEIRDGEVVAQPDEEEQEQREQEGQEQEGQEKEGQEKEGQEKEGQEKHEQGNDGQGEEQEEEQEGQEASGGADEESETDNEGDAEEETGTGRADEGRSGTGQSGDRGKGGQGRRQVPKERAAR